MWKALSFCYLSVEKVDRRREARAETVARIDNAIEDELLKRLQSGTYGDIYNFPMEQYNKVNSLLNSRDHNHTRV